MMDDYNSMNNEMQELAEQVREHYPNHPERAFNVYCKSYPSVVAASMVQIVWSFMEYQIMVRTGLHFTRPLQKHELSILNNPYLLN